MHRSTRFRHALLVGLSALVILGAAGCKKDPGGASQEGRVDAPSGGRTYRVLGGQVTYSGTSVRSCSFPAGECHDYDGGYREAAGRDERSTDAQFSVKAPTDPVGESAEIVVDTPLTIDRWVHGYTYTRRMSVTPCGVPEAVKATDSDLRHNGDPAAVVVVIPAASPREVRAALRPMATPPSTVTETWAPTGGCSATTATTERSILGRSPFDYYPEAPRTRQDVAPTSTVRSCTDQRCVVRVDGTDAWTYQGPIGGDGLTGQMRIHWWFDIEVAGRSDLRADDAVIDVDYDFGTEAPTKTVAPLQYASGTGLRLDAISAASRGGITTGSATGDQFTFVPSSRALVGPVDIDYTVKDAAGNRATGTITLVYRGCRAHDLQLATANLGGVDPAGSRIAPGFKVCTDFQSAPQIRDLDVQTEANDGLAQRASEAAVSTAVAAVTRGFGGFEVTRDYLSDPAPDGSFVYRRQSVCDHWTLTPGGPAVSAALKPIVDKRVVAGAGWVTDKVVGELADLGASVQCADRLALTGAVTGDGDGYTITLDSGHEAGVEAEPRATLRLDDSGPYDVSAGTFSTVYHCPAVADVTEPGTAKLGFCQVTGPTRQS